MDKLTLAYLAGIIDADGTIGIKRSTYAMRVRGDAGAPIFSERVCVKQVTPEAVTMLRDAFGGRFGVDDPSAKRGRPLHVWQVTDLQAANCLRALLPYLRIKRAQAEACLELRDLKEKSRAARTCAGRGHVGGKARPPEITAGMELLKERIAVLNKVGV